jgi:peptide/nickel transport system permease protein
VSFLLKQGPDMVSEKKKSPAIRFRWGFLIPLLIIILFVISATFADFLVTHNPKGIDLANSLTPPIWQEGGKAEFPLGTDMNGRDILSRLIYGARISLIVALISVFVAGSIGGVLGILAGYKGGWVDSIISRAIDVFLGLPLILLALALAIILGASMLNVILVLVLVFWALYARMARSETLQVREMGYVTLARTAGCSDFTIMWRHILPNVLNSLIVMSTFNIGSAIILEAALSFLGAGIPPPTPSWGAMCADGQDILTRAWWVSFMPGVAIMLVVLSGNLLGDWLRDKLDPKLRDLY